MLLMQYSYPVLCSGFGACAPSISALLEHGKAHRLTVMPQSLATPPSPSKSTSSLCLSLVRLHIQSHISIFVHHVLKRVLYCPRFISPFDLHWPFFELLFSSILLYS